MMATDMKASSKMTIITDIKDSSTFAGKFSFTGVFSKGVLN